MLLSLSSVSYADCDSLVAKLSTFLNYPNSETDGEQSFTSCKAWPADPSKTIVALVHFQKGSYFNAPPVPGNGLFDLDVLIVKSDNGEILQRHLQKGALSSDAMALSGITIDTARYTLAQQIRAFGVRADFSHSGGSNPAHYQVINLYIAESKKISQVLSRLIVFQENAEQLGDGCSGTSSETKRTLAIAKTHTHGYADLMVVEKSINRESKFFKNDCVVTEIPFSRQYTLQFDGNAYPVPKELRY